MDRPEPRSSLPSNGEFAAVFQEIADLMQLRGESVYRKLAYERAADSFRIQPVSVAELVHRGELRQLPGVGEAIAAKAEEYLTTGHIHLLEELRREFPHGLVELMHVPGLGAKTARRLYEEAGITDIDSLREAAEAGRLRSLPGMGAKTEAKLLKGLSAARPSRPERQLLGRVEPIAAVLTEHLRTLPAVQAADYAGSLRRRRETVRDIDLVVASETPEEVMEGFAAFPEVAGVAERGRTKLVGRTHGDLNVDLRIVSPASYGNLLQHFTGSADHNVALRGYAQRLGFKVSEYHLEELSTGRLIQCRSEGEVYASLGLPFIPPELREGRGEVESAREGRLPRLIELADLRGDLHVHSDWSDGKSTMESMALAARRRGLEYLCFSDHSQSLAMTGGLTPDRVRRQIEEIQDLDARLGDFTVLCGSEVDILADGRIDLPDEVLAELDWVTASIHSAFAQSVDQIMGRLESAMEHPFIDAIGHPTGRLLGRREPYAIDIERLVIRAAETETALEINASYDRLDLCALHARLAKERGAALVISSDAHGPGGFDLLRFGIGEARRGWIEPADVVNTRPVDVLLSSRPKRQDRRGRSRTNP